MAYIDLTPQDDLSKLIKESSHITAVPMILMIGHLLHHHEMTRDDIAQWMRQSKIDR